MASKPNIDDVKLLQEALATKLEAITKTMVEDVLTGGIDSHTHNYATSSQGDKADTAIQGVSVNNTELTSDDNKKVNITVPTTVSELSDSNEYAHLSNGKILEGNLPDYIFGQVLFGGFVAYIPANNNLVCTLSDKLKSKYNVTDNTLVLENMPASTYEGVYFIATNDFMTSIDVKIGDWLISNGRTWSKVDNTDAVMSVNGQTGVVVLTPADVGAASSNHNHNYWSLDNIPENISMGGFVPSELNLKNIIEPCIRPLQYGHKYYSAPNKICGTDETRDDLEGFLFVYLKDNIVSQQLHDTINNILYIRSFNRISGEWSLWKRLLTCVDETDVIEQEGEEYIFTLERNNTEIYIPSGEGVFDSKNDAIIIDVSNIIIGGRSHFWIYFNVPISGAININIETNDSNLITSGSFYIDPAMLTSQIVSGIEYIVWRYPTYWHIVNRIF